MVEPGAIVVVVPGNVVVAARGIVVVINGNIVDGTVPTVARVGEEAEVVPG